ncbi:hypothetical protein EB1_00570 [Empedobacter brevis NBRC 14943 = ATCC 43319]|uniref:Uncharacterized protein n=1 Tax=Empedobacter brevis NBRC 14943 = ATCC 43319 TaxID=1218108 RepID=A0A511NCD8_9FLAO|nr:hypothetical protein EB1_00570 [Empedobacter brevis NBRC 14943 = ATCC 43319]
MYSRFSALNAYNPKHDENESVWLQDKPFPLILSAKFDEDAENMDVELFDK